MICKHCRNKEPEKCPGGTWCDCQHYEGEGVNWSLVHGEPQATPATAPVVDCLKP